MAITPEEQQTVIDRLLELFQSNEAAIQYGEDPGAWVDENLPDGVEPADVASCMPEVADRLGGPYQSNAAQYNAYHGAGGSAATSTVVNEISYTYNTIYQQNAFIYAEEGAQVTNIQGDGNTVTQVQIDDSFNAEHPDGWEDDDEPELPEEVPVDEEGNPLEPEDGYEEPEGEEGEDGDYEEPEDGYEEPVEMPEEPAYEPDDGGDGYEPDAGDGGGEAAPEPDDMDGME